MAADFDQWAAENGDLLRIVWEDFDRTGEWPQGATLTRRHFRNVPRRDYAEIARLMPPQLGRADPSNDGRIMLTPRGLSYLPDTAPLLQAFVALLRRAVQRYEDDTEEAIITAVELPELLGIEPRLAAQLEFLVTLDSWALMPSGGFAGAGDMRIGISERSVSSSPAWRRSRAISKPSWRPGTRTQRARTWNP